MNCNSLAMKRFGIVAVTAILMYGCGSDGTGESELPTVTSTAEPTAAPTPTAEPTPRMLTWRCSDKRENAGLEYEFDLDEMSHADAADEFCGPPNPTPDPDDCEFEWQIFQLWSQSMGEIFDILAMALITYDYGMIGEAYKGINEEIALMRPKVRSLLRDCPDAYYEYLWDGMVEWWEGMRRTCRQYDLEFVIDEC